MLNAMLRRLQGSNLEVFKFGLYILFPIGWMYYFGTNLENRFSVPDFWPRPEESHRIPVDRSEIEKELARMSREKEQKLALEKSRSSSSAAAAAGDTEEG